MSSPQVTFQELVQAWKVLADKSHVDCMKADMRNFFLQCKNEACMSVADVARRKNTIIQIWVETDWKTAQKNNPHWTIKGYWEKRLQVIDKAFGVILKEVYEIVAERKPSEKPASKPAPKQQEAAAEVKKPYHPPKLRVVSSFNFDMDDDENENTFWSGEESEAHTREYLKKLKEQVQ